MDLFGDVFERVRTDYVKQVKHPSDLVIGQKITNIGNTSFVITSVVFDSEGNVVAVSKITSVCFDFDSQSSVPVYDKIKADYNKWKYWE